MKIKAWFVSIFSICLVFAMGIPAYAAGWIKDKAGYKHEDRNGALAFDEWRWIDRRPTDTVGDGISWCYYFDKSGYMVRNSGTPGGYWVNDDGAWVDGGNVQQTSINSEIPTPQSSWKLDSYGYWYQNPDGSYPVNEWKWIDMRWHDTKPDNIAWCYYFDSRGYMIFSTVAPDGSAVNGDGAWTVSGIAQHRRVR